MINSCTGKAPILQLLDTKRLSIPSASAIEFYNNKLYVFGDDATYLLVLSPDYQTSDTAHYLPQSVGRLPKETKPDIESATLMMKNGQTTLLGFGSMSAKNRWGAVNFFLNDLSFTKEFPFDTTKGFPGIDEINIEGSCLLGNTIILSNRANLSHKLNQLLFIDDRNMITIKPLLLPDTGTVQGVSGLYYLKEIDVLFFTTSEEATFSAVDDGAIGESRIGWINSFSKKLNVDSLAPDKVLKLSDFHTAFLKQKIESLCVEKMEGENIILHLVADNDTGESKIFKLAVRL